VEPKYAQISMPLEAIDLHVANPRFDPVEDQRAAIHAVCEDQGPKLIALAEDILHEGTSPVDFIFVVKGTMEGRYVVADGNRRITALKLLSQPGRIDDTPFEEPLKKRMKHLASKFDQKKYEAITCIVAPDFEATRHWVSLRHTGENEGAGVVRWNGAATARFRGSSRGYGVIEFVREQLKSTADEGILDRFPVTNLERLLGDPDVRKHLGLTLKSGRLLSIIDPKSAAENLYEIMKDLKSPDVAVGDVYTKDDRRDYMKRMAPRIKSGVILPAPQALDPVDSGSGLAASPKPSAKAGPAKKGSTPSSKTRRVLIPRTTTFPVEAPRVNEIYRELRRLKVSLFPNAVAVLARVFLECSLDIYIKNLKLGADLSKEAGEGKQIKLKHKAACVKKHLVASGADASTVNAGYRVFTSAESPLSIEHLNLVVHNPHWHPDGPGLLRDWDVCEGFFRELWNRVK